MAYANPNDERRVQKDFEYMNSERGYVGRAIGGKLKPSYRTYGGHKPDPSMDKKEFWRLYMNHIINMKIKFPKLLIQNILWSAVAEQREFI